MLALTGHGSRFPARLVVVCGEGPAGWLGPLLLFAALLGDLADDQAADVVLFVALVGLVEQFGRVLHHVRVFERLGCLKRGQGERVADLDVLAAADGLDVGERLADVLLQCDGLAADGFRRVRRFTLLSMSLLIGSPCLVWCRGGCL